uniref:Uncharacterized protein n=1 Tax=Opuntia streptacantha TaxID=393608 RepID=A0A7C8ZYQ9_OPUST
MTNSIQLFKLSSSSYSLQCKYISSSTQVVKNQKLSDAQEAFKECPISSPSQCRYMTSKQQHRGEDEKLILDLQCNHIQFYHEPLHQPQTQHPHSCRHHSHNLAD